MEGQVIAGRYRLVRLLGKGGMGAVWLAEQLSLHTPVAIKLIDFEAAKNANARTRFEREAQVVARIRSAHVVKVLDHGVTEAGLPFIAMECLVGESLRDRLTSRQRLSLAETAKVVSHVCRALSKAHEAGLVHRDLKPENIFVAKEDDGEIVKILDFGVAKATDILSSTGMDPTRTGALLGTPYYMSPEQAQGLKTVDYRSDLWAVGVLAFECLTGKRPFAAPALGPLIAKIVAGPLPSMAQAAPDAGIPAEVEAWFQKALARNPAQRFATAKEMSDSFMVAAGVMDTLDRGALQGPGGGGGGGAAQNALADARTLWASSSQASAGPQPSPEENMSTVLLDSAHPALAPTPLPFARTSLAVAGQGHSGAEQGHSGAGQGHSGAGQGHSGAGQAYSGAGPSYSGAGQAHSGAGQAHSGAQPGATLGGMGLPQGYAPPPQPGQPGLVAATLSDVIPGAPPPASLAATLPGSKSPVGLIVGIVAALLVLAAAAAFFLLR